jgi:hypothetical protein
MVIMKPQPVFAESRTLPPLIARSRASETLPERLGAGSRMEVYPLVDEQTVLRVPRRTEQHLINIYGSSGRKALATGHEVSVITERELHDLEAMGAFIGAFVPDTAPFADLDLEGNFRYYALQRRVRVIQDLRICTQRLVETHSLYSLERFVRDVRDMVHHLGLIPDFGGKGNLVLDRYGLVKLIDINNFRRLVPNELIDECFGPDHDWSEYALGRKDVRKEVPAGFVDDQGHPIADLSLATLQNLEVRGLGRDYKQVIKDPFYAPLHHETRRILITLLRPVMA